jgi:hypothetical protein
MFFQAQPVMGGWGRKSKSADFNLTPGNFLSQSKNVLAHPQFLQGDLGPAGRAIPSDSKAKVPP